MSSTVRARSSSASSILVLTRFSSATGHAANETRSLLPSSFQRCSAVNGINGARSRTRLSRALELPCSRRSPREPAAVPLQVGLDPERGLLECLTGLEVFQDLGHLRDVLLEPADQPAVDVLRLAAASLISMTCW